MGGNGDKDEEERPWQSFHTVYTNAKAGMEGVDKEKVQKIVYEMSKGSKYFENEQKKEADVMQKVEDMCVRCSKLTESDLSHFQMLADKRVLELESSRDLSKIWVHIDMDAFYAAVETLENPSLKDKPLAVGSMSMISTANYEARKYGVRAAMPGFIACKLCPELIFVPTHFEKYTHYSELTRIVFHEYDPNFIASSLDEAYLDITGVCKERDLSGSEVAEEIRSRVFNATGLTCSAGVAPNRLLAKVCSDINKPNGQFVLPNVRDAVITFVSSLPTRKITGIGKVTEQVLKHVLGIKTCEEILQKRAMICALFSQLSSDFFLSVSLGLGGTDTPMSRLRKSISCEQTFSATNDESQLLNRLVDIAGNLSIDMQKDNLSGRTLTLKLKTSSFEVRNRAVSLQRFISSKDDILVHASKLLKPELPLSLRLIGLRMSHFQTELEAVDPTQRTLSNFIIKNNLSASGEERNNQLDNHMVADCASDQSEDSISIPCPDFNHSSVELAWSPSIDMFDDQLDREQPSEIELLTRVENGSGKEAETSAMVEDADAERERTFWIDEYRCSICGVELPPTFVVERQEHFDYHLAERIQREESLQAPPSSTTPKKRALHTTRGGKKTERKKHMPAGKEAKHIPIDAFFFKEK